MHYQSLVEDYKQTERIFRQQANSITVKDYLDRFRTLSNQNKLLGDQKNIDYWAGRGFEEFKKFVVTTETTPSFKKMKKGLPASNYINLYTKNGWDFLIPLDKQTSVFLGKGTDWCTAKTGQNDFENYFYRNKIILVYCIGPTPNDKVAIAFYNKDPQLNWSAYDITDQGIDDNIFERITGMPPEAIVELARQDHITEKIDIVRFSREKILDDASDFIHSILPKMNHDEYKASAEAFENTLISNSLISHLSGYISTVATLFGERVFIGPRQVETYCYDFSKKLEIFTAYHLPKIVFLFKNPSRSTVKISVVKNAEAIKYYPGDKELLSLALRQHGQKVMGVAQDIFDPDNMVDFVNRVSKHTGYLYNNNSVTDIYYRVVHYAMKNYSGADAVKICNAVLDHAPEQIREILDHEKATRPIIEMTIAQAIHSVIKNYDNTAEQYYFLKNYILQTPEYLTDGVKYLIFDKFSMGYHFLAVHCKSDLPDDLKKKMIDIDPSYRHIIT